MGQKDFYNYAVMLQLFVGTSGFGCMYVETTFWA